jgi:hypothetical protein
MKYATGTQNMHIMRYFYASNIRLLGVSQVEMATISNRGLYELKGGHKSFLHLNKDQCSTRVPIHGDRSGDLPLYYDNVCFSDDATTCVICQIPGIFSAK